MYSACDSKFSSEAEVYAKHNQIALYYGEKLKNYFYFMSIGRLESKEIVLDDALSAAMEYNEANNSTL